MKTESGALQERPLSGSSRLALFCGAGATILLSYFVSSIFLVFLLGLIGCEFVLMLALARFGMARLMANTLGAHIPLLTVFFRSFWLRKGVEFRIPLQSAEAPNLFKMLNGLCENAQVGMPQEVMIEMGVNAWVRLKGYRRGAGRTTLGIGYDLLAGLSDWEMEGVLAHEITHAKLVQRGYKNWLNRGLGRMVQLARGLYAHVEAFRKANRLIPPAPFLFQVSDRLTRLAARFVAGCSRQDEFDADRGAAALCGAGAIRSSLLKLDPLARHAARLPWNERVARLQAGEGFSQWLVSELASADFKQTGEGEQKLFFKYSTHPSLGDRLAALPEQPEDEQPPDTKPAIQLLRDPDKVAEVLIYEIQKRAAEEEKKDSKRLRRLARQSGMRGGLRPVQTAGVLLLLVGAVCGLMTGIATGFSLGVVGFTSAAIIVGVTLVRQGRYRERLTLAVPDFSVLKSWWQNRPKFTAEQVKAMEAEVKAQVANTRGASRREFEFAKICYEALGRCDYVRAHIAARFCLQVNNKSMEGAAGLAVAGAALGQVPQVSQTLRYLQKAGGMSASSIVWSAAWALLLCGDWAPAEAFLEKVCAQRPKNATLLLLLALCQSKRGKFQSALLTAREACRPQPANTEHAKFLIDLLLQVGYLREAQERLKLLKAPSEEDMEVLLMLLRLNLLLRRFAAADELCERARKKQSSADLLVRLGQFHEVARRDEKAAGFYNEALTAGFYPESLLGLARLETRRRNKEQAKKHLIAALNTERALGEKATGPLPLFHQITTQLLSLAEPIPNCRAWVASLNGGNSPPGLGNKSILIYAAGRSEAEQFLNELFSAMQPGKPPIVTSNIGWREAEKEKQPDGPVRAGIQCVLN